MNRNIFKVIFSRKLGQLTVVSENTTADGKAAAESTGSQWGYNYSSVLNPISFLLMLTLGTAAILPAQAQIVADPTAPGNQQATVLTTASGVTQVNIQTPSAAGVSVNQYKQFDVNSNGVVLNNSRTSTNTQIAGYVQGNPWLATGSARVIVNNVNSSNPSYLNGYVEVAGQKAEVILANPAGISVSGGGFINASRTTLTTGAPIINGGSLEGYRVTSGQISIDGQGLDTSQSDYTDILARSVKVNAGIWANNLKVVAGANQIDAANTNATTIAGTGAVPSYAIDTAALGGMYAGKIILVGTEQGLGVNNAGQLAASAGNVAISSNGMLTNSGTINANGADNVVTINTTGVANSGTISSQGNNHIAATTVQNSGTLAAGRELKVNATDIDNSNGVMNGQRVEVNAASLNNTKGKIQQTGSQAIVLNAGSLSNTNGGLIGYEPISSGSGTGTGSTGGSTGGTTGGSTGTTDTPSTAAGGGTASVVQPAPVVLADGVINVTGNINNDAGQITANGGIDLTSSNGLTNSATLNLNKLKVTGNALDNSGGTITTTQASINTNSITNTAGKFGSSGNVDLTANNLSNSKGQITAGGTLTSNISGAVLNDDGTIGSAGEHALNAGSINNTNGTIASTGAGLTVQSGVVNNTKGAIQSATTTQITSTTFDNTDGKVAGTTVNLNTQNNTLTNTRGTVSADSTTVNSGAFTNDAGLIQGSNELTINTNGQNLTNTNSGTTGGIISGGTLKVDSGDVNNSAGYVSSKGNATINAAQIANSNGGQIIGEADNTLTASGIDNRGGQIITVGNATIAVGASTVNNDNSLIRSGGTTTINAATVINTNTNTMDKGIDSGTVAITANTVDNTAGAIRADETLAITSSGAVNNTNGLLTSSKVIEVKDPNATTASKTLAVTNTNGTVIAGTSNTIDAKSLTGDGKVLSNGDMSINLTDDFTNNATVQVANNLTLTSAGNVTNNAKILAGETNSINAQNITNANGAEISGGTTTLTANDAVTNRGLIDGINTIVKGNTVTNIGTGRIYGDHLSIGATTLNNTVESGTAATIAARNRLDIGATTINNQEHSTLFSGGDMSIGGSLDANNNATGRANVINNESATIESLGNMRLAANQINNRNMHFATAIQQVSQERVGEVIGVVGDADKGIPAASGVSQLYSVDSTQLANMPNLSNEVSGDYMLNSANNVYITPSQSNYLVAPEGAYSSWELRDFTRTTSESVVTETDPSKIIAGGNLTLDTGNLLNDNSQIIVGGTLQGDAANITNSQTAGQRIVADSGTRLSNWRDHDKGRDEPGTETNPYNVTHPTQSITIDTSVKQTGVNGNTGMSVGGMTGNSLTDTATGSSTANASATVYAVDTTDPTLIKTGVVNTNMPNSSLFTINPNNAGYLIETDPRFADYRQWLSSDFMLASLNLDPALMHKRLGDGFYEQKLIREQIAQLTGRRYLTGYGNDDDQYKALMTAGVTFAGQYNLRPGIALTNEQMARLTSDIVWLVEEEVTLPNGTKTRALVPKVYVAVKPGDIDGSGSLISANRINLNLSGDLNNAGTVSGRTVTQITAQNINNMGGRINADQLNLNARNDLNNIGGMIDANTSAVLHAGRDVNSVTTTSTAANNYGSKTIIDRVAGIYVGNGADSTIIGSETTTTVPTTLSITAGNNVNLVGSEVANDGIGGTLIKADNNVNLSTVDVANQETFYRNSRNGYSIDEKSEVGTNINGVGNIKLQAGNDLNARAANVNSETGNLIATAGHDVNITAGESSRSTVADDYEKQSGFLKKKTTQIHTESDTTNSIGSNFTGNQVLVGAGHDANIQGSNLVSDTLTWVDAKNNVNITAAENTESYSSFKEVKKSGLMGTGGVGFMVGKTQNSLETDAAATTHTGSLIASNSGDVKLTAGKTLNIEGSDVLAANNATLVANNINIVNSTDTYTQSTEQKSKSSGLTVALAGTVGDAANGIVSTVNQANAASDRGNDRLAAAYGTKAALTAAQAGQSLYQDFTDVSSANKANQGNFIGVSVSVGSSKSQSNTTSTQTVANGSNIAAGNNLTILATGDGTKGADGFATDGDVNVIGSNLSGKNVNVTGARDVNFESAANTSVENSTNKSSSANVGVSLGVSASGSFGLSVFANAAVGKGKAGGNGTTYTETQVTATDNLSVNAGRDFNMTGAQARGDSIDVDVGRNLTITSEQDTNDYKSKQTNASVGVSIPIYGAGSASVNVGVNQQKVNSTYASVNEQSGLFAGNGGFDVNVKGHTQLNGGAIASTAPSEFNSLTTGSLGYTDIENHAEYRATSSGINVGTGSLLSNALKNATSALPMSGNQSDSDSSTTRSVISPATVVIAGQAATDAQLAGLSRDAASANDSLKPIFDLQQVQDDMALGQVVGEIGTQATSIVSTAMQRDEYVKHDEAMKSAEENMKANNPTAYAEYIKSPSEAALLNYEFNNRLANDPVFNSEYGSAYAALTKPEDQIKFIQDLVHKGETFGDASQAAYVWHHEQAQYGPGSGFSRAAQALTGLASGIAGGNVGQGLSAAAAPFLVNAAGAYFDNLMTQAQTNGESTAAITAGRLLTHAAIGAAVAYASGNDVGSGAIGGVSGEAMAMLVHQQLYGGKPTSELTIAEKENIRAVSTLASALVGGVAGGNFESAAVAAGAGYNAAVNNDTGSKGNDPAWVRNQVTQAINSGDPAALERFFTSGRDKDGYPFSAESEARMLRQAENNLAEIKVFANWATNNCAGMDIGSCRSAYNQSRVENGLTALSFIPVERLIVLGVKFVKGVVVAYKAEKIAQTSLAMSKMTRKELQAIVFSGRTAPEIKGIFEWGDDVKGATEALENVSITYMNKVKSSVSREYVEAVKWFYVKAAEAGRGLPTAQYRIKLMDEIIKHW